MKRQTWRTNLVIPKTNPLKTRPVPKNPKCQRPQLSHAVKSSSQNVKTNPALVPKVSPVSSLRLEGPLITIAISDAWRIQKVVFSVIISFTHNTLHTVSPYFFAQTGSRERERERERRKVDFSSAHLPHKAGAQGALQ